MHVPSHEGYRLWASSYDRDPNPLLALEERIAHPILGSLDGLRIVDVCTGTGRWMEIGRRAADMIGVDLCAEMLEQAAYKAGRTGRLVVGDAGRIPIEDSWADLAICSFGISYIRRIEAVFREMSRIANRVMISDMHPEAARAGWCRSFETSSHTYRLVHYTHSLDELEIAAHNAGLSPEWFVEAGFGDPERRIFASAGKEYLFDRVAGIPAIFVKTWRC